MDAVERIVNLNGGFGAFHKDVTMTAKLALYVSIEIQRKLICH